MPTKRKAVFALRPDGGAGNHRKGCPCTRCVAARAAPELERAGALLAYTDAPTDYYTRRMWVKQLVKHARDHARYKHQLRELPTLRPIVPLFRKYMQFSRKRAADFARCLVGPKPKRNAFVP